MSTLLSVSLDIRVSLWLLFNIWSQSSFSFSINMLGWTLIKAIISPNLKCNNPLPQQFNILKSGSIVQSMPKETFLLPLRLPHPLTCYQIDGIFQLKNPLSPLRAWERGKKNYWWDSGGAFQLRRSITCW